MTRSPSLEIIATVIALLALPSGAHAAVPADAQNVIREVHAAAEKKDFAKLRTLMVTEFQWSFGGDADADQAVGEWKKESRYLRNLARVTAQPCGFLTAKIIQCPARGAKGYRAGFVKTSAGWRMEYFIAGD